MPCPPTRVPWAAGPVAGLGINPAPATSERAPDFRVLSLSGDGWAVQPGPRRQPRVVQTAQSVVGGEGYGGI